MLIPRPTHNDYLYNDTPTYEHVGGDQSKHCAWVKWFFEQTPWVCPTCRARVVYSCDYCPCCRFGPHRRHTPKPTA